MYKVIGADQKEYGPIDAETVRVWLAQGRIYAQSPVKLEPGGSWKSLDAYPEFPVLTPPPIPARQPEADSGIATLIPYKNAPALAAYYLAVFSLIPLVGLFLGIAAVVLGIMGLRCARQHPEAKGRVHAWVGIVVGGFFGLVYLALVVIMVIAIVSEARHGR